MASNVCSLSWDDMNFKFAVIYLLFSLPVIPRNLLKFLPTVLPFKRFIFCIILKCQLFRHFEETMRKIGSCFFFCGCLLCARKFNCFSLYQWRHYRKGDTAAFCLWDFYLFKLIFLFVYWWFPDDLKRKHVSYFAINYL